MDEYAEKLIVALMVVIQEKGGEYRLDTDAFQQMFDLRHSKGNSSSGVGKRHAIETRGYDGSSR